MEASISAPLLSRIKSWQLFWLGISGWVTLYSAAILSWGASSFVIGNAQGGSFAAVMTLAGREVKRFQRGGSLNQLQWAGGITTEQLNQTLTQALQKNELVLEALHPIEADMGFGLRAVKAGRTFLFETARWKEPIINLLHAKTTEENRSKTSADFAVIVGAGMPDEDTKQFVNTHPVKLLAGKELKDLFAAENPPVENTETMSTPASGLSLPCSPGDTTISSNKPNAANNNPAKNVKPAGSPAKSSGNTQDASATNLRMRMR
jgi:hypothetical protein